MSQNSPNAQLTCFCVILILWLYSSLNKYFWIELNLNLLASFSPSFPPWNGPNFTTLAPASLKVGHFAILYNMLWPFACYHVVYSAMLRIFARDPHTVSTTVEGYTTQALTHGGTIARHWEGLHPGLVEWRRIQRHCPVDLLFIPFNIHMLDKWYWAEWWWVLCNSGPASDDAMADFRDPAVICIDI